MNLILAWWHDKRADWNQDELDLRTEEFSASDVWACRVAVSIAWHRDEAERRRASSRMLRLFRAVAAAFRDMRRAA